MQKKSESNERRQFIAVLILRILLNLQMCRHILFYFRYLYVYAMKIHAFRYIFFLLSENCKMFYFILRKKKGIFPEMIFSLYSSEVKTFMHKKRKRI